MPLSGDEQIQQALAEIPATESLVAVFVAQTGNTATVSHAGAWVQVKSSTQAPVFPGDSVRLERRNGELVMTGPTAPRAVVGVIKTVGNPAVVEYPAGSGVTAVLPVMNGQPLTVGDKVFLDWGSNGLIVGRIASPITPPKPPDPGGGGLVEQTQRFEATDSGSWQSGYGWRTNDVWSSERNQGCWFYGSKIRDTIPDTAQIVAASIHLVLQSELGAAPFGRHDAEVKPGGPVAFSATAELPSRSGEVPVPTSLIDYLKANPGGLGFDYGGLNIWTGTQRDGGSGALTVTYRA